MLWKIGGALLIALLASIITVIAGVLSDARSGTVMLRAVFAFAVSGFGLVFGMLIMERYGIPFYMSKHKEEEQSDLMKLYFMLKEMEKEEQSEGSTEGEPQEEQSLLDVSISDEITSDTAEIAESPVEEASKAENMVEADLKNEEGNNSFESEAMESLTEEEIASLTTEPATESSATEAEKEEIQMEEKEAPAFAPLSADSMTRLVVPGEAST